MAAAATKSKIDILKWNKMEQSKKYSKITVFIMISEVKKEEETMTNKIDIMKKYHRGLRNIIHITC